MPSACSAVILCHECLLLTGNARSWAMSPMHVTGSRVRITVKLYAVLQIGRFREKALDFPVGAKVIDVVNGLELPSEHVDILLVNGRHVDREALLQDGDILSLLPMVEGG